MSYRCLVLSKITKRERKRERHFVSPLNMYRGYLVKEKNRFFKSSIFYLRVDRIFESCVISDVTKVFTWYGLMTNTIVAQTLKKNNNNKKKTSHITAEFSFVSKSEKKLVSWPTFVL